VLDFLIWFKCIIFFSKLNTFLSFGLFMFHSFFLVVTCRSVPLETFNPRVNHCMYSPMVLYEYRGCKSKPIRVGNCLFTQGLRYLEVITWILFEILYLLLYFSLGLNNFSRYEILYLCNRLRGSIKFQKSHLLSMVWSNHMQLKK